MRISLVKVVFARLIKPPLTSKEHLPSLGEIGQTVQDQVKINGNGN